jgi:hypothetical protein
MNELAMLPSAQRLDVFELIDVCTLIAGAKSRAAGIRQAVAMGYKEGTIKRKFQRWQKYGVQGLIDRRKLVRSAARLDVGEAFKGYCEQNQRSTVEGYRQMMRDFRNGKHIPDVGDWRQVWAMEHPDIATPRQCPLDYTPKGWSYHNLQRGYGLTKYELTASRIGRGTAKDYLPSVYSTRAGLLVGQMYMFDDMWWDLKVNYPGNQRAQRVIELAVVDVASACRFAWGAKPRREDLDTGKMRNLNECDMRQLLAHVLINIGFHPEGCRMVVEHGTAAASSELEALIGHLTQGAVTFERSGIISDPIHKGLWCGQPRGNYKRKAALESQHSLCHTVAAALKGQIGRNRDNAPEQMYGLEQYNTQLIKAAAALPPERARMLMLPVLSFNDAVAAMSDLYRAMNLRTWHNLEGWEECGYVATQYRVSPFADDWFSADRLLDLPGDEYAVLYSAIQAHPEKFSRTIRLAPQHVFDAGKQQLTKLPKSCMPQILGEKLAIQKTIRPDGLITYSNQEFGPSEFRYLARSVKDINGFDVALAPGLKVMIHINPFNTDECFVSHAESGAYIGIASRWQTVCKTDTAALERQAGKQAHIEAQLRAPMARRGQKVIKEKIAAHQHNARVLGGAPIVEGDGAPIDDADMDAVTDFEPTDDSGRVSDEEIAELLREDRGAGLDFEPDDLF